MIKVAFFLDNEKISSVDCSRILEGNPGIGGTEQMIISIAYLLTLRNNGIEVKIFTTKQGCFPEELNYIVVDSFCDALFHAKNEKYEYFVFKHDANYISNGLLDNVDSKIKLIPWCHVFICYWELDYYANNNSVYQIISVAREMNDLYRDHKAFRKSSYIYNCINLKGKRERVANYPFKDRSHIVTYIGCIVPYKGLHLLAQAWSYVLQEVSDAELYIIGSGSLYGNISEMGERGIAEKSYEELLMRYLSKDGKILPSVHFMGIMGEEKDEILLRTRVGVPNPTGVTETFGISAVEMQMFGAKVTTIKCPGYIDTVKNGFLYSRKKELADCIVSLLKNEKTQYDETMTYFEENFSQEIVAERWEALFSTGMLPKDTKLYNRYYRYKFLKERIRFLKEHFPILYKIFPPLERILLFLEKIVCGTRSYFEV